MDDLISRKAAIYAMNEVYRHIKMIKKRPVNKTEQAMYLDMIGAVKSVPSVQPELIEKAAYIRGFEQGRTQGMIDSQGGKK